MHQTKIGQFFKKTALSPTASPIKDSSEDLKAKALKFSDTDESNDTTDKDKTLKVKMAFSNKKDREKEKERIKKSSSKRKSQHSSEEEAAATSDESPKSKPRKNDALLKKKPRRRIVVESSSDEENQKMDVDEDVEKETKKIKCEDVKEINDDEITEKKDKSDRDNDIKSNGSSKKSSSQNDKKAKDVSASSDEEENAEEAPPPKPKPTQKGKEKKKTSTSKSKPNKTEKDKKSSPTDKKNEKKRTKTELEKDAKESKKEKEEMKPMVSARPSTATLGGGAGEKKWNPDYDPSKSKYNPLEDASWERGEKVPYLALAKTLQAIEATSSRLKFIEILANYFRSVILLSPDDLLYSVYLCLNKLAPAYEGVELGVAETNIMKAIAQATGRSLDKIKSDAGTLGDLGLVAEQSRSNQKTLFQPLPLTVSGVFTKLKEIAAMSGHASHAKKISMITSMLVACKYSEARYLTRSLLGKLRIGLAEQSLLQALAQATYLTPPNQDMSEWPPKIVDAGRKMSPDSLKAKIESHAFILKSCYCECPNYDTLVKAMLEVGIDGLEERCKLTPGVPPRPMLAQPTKGVADVLDRFDGIRFTCEYKYDGERAQVHLLENGALQIYSRNQENNTSKYPDIISRFSKCIKGDVKSCILDTEAVAWDLEKKTILPFQVLSTRKRKDANESEIKVQVCLFGFDLIYLNGETLIKEPLFKRRELLREHFQEVEGEFLFATSLDTNSMEEVQEFLEESIKGNCEGLMVKTLDERATYELAKRSQKWLKLKKDYLDSGGDSLDLVVIGGFLGKGKRTGTYGGFLLACYDPDEEVYQTICKLGTGFTDEQLQSHSETLKPHVIPNAKSYYRFNQQLAPDHWFDAVQVWEVKCADLSLSPVHTAGEGIVDPQRGISLRFPRFLRIRDDKNIEDATSSQQVADMYKSQEVVKNSTKDKEKNLDDEDFY